MINPNLIMKCAYIDLNVDPLKQTHHLGVNFTIEIFVS
jgi:hypothetical protein